MKRILHLSDPHFGAADAKIARAFLEAAHAMRPDATILSGDLSMRARRLELSAAKHFFGELPEPKFIIPGNHDIPALNHVFDRFFRPFRRYADYFGEQLEPVLDIPSVRFLGLNSSRPFGFHADWSQGFLSPMQLHKIRTGFSDTLPENLRVVVVHHPLIQLDHGREIVRPISALQAALGEAGADIVLCGHFHRSTLGTVASPDGWQALVSQAPTVCSTRLQGEPQGFHEILWAENSLEIRVHRFDGGRFLPSDHRKFQKSANGWKS